MGNKKKKEKTNFQRMDDLYRLEENNKNKIKLRCPSTKTCPTKKEKTTKTK